MTEHHYHIMLVEDSVTQAISLTAVLEREGWQVTWVSDAEKAFASLRSARPDLILLDYYLPGIRGDEVCRRIRMNVDCRNLPIVMLTSQEGHEVQGLDSGADDFVSKSTNREVLLLRLRTLLQKTRQEDRIILGSEDSFREARLLVIDDSPTFLARVSSELASEGYHLETSEDPEQGLERLRQGLFDGVIIDLIMPRMDGLEVCRKVAELRSQLHLPLISIVVTGAENPGNLSKALEAGADDFVGKSSDFSVLKGRIRALLRRKFFAEENTRILQELRQKELEALRERTAKEAAQARAALVEQLEQKTEELKISQGQLQRANAAKDQFLAVLSHELRTPLTPVLAVVTERSEDGSLPEDVRRDFSLIRRNVELETHLINDLLDLTRIAQGKLEIHRVEVDLKEIIQHVVTMCRTVDTPTASLSVNFTASSSLVLGDAMRLTQVVWNLLQNAIKFTPPHGRIDIQLTNAAGVDGVTTVVMEIRDTGAGIEASMISSIFDAFQQESREVTRQFGGLGLGLAISKAIIGSHEGSLTASSPGKNQGATFRLELPGVVAAASPPAGVQSPLPPPTATTGSGLCILLVEDHRDTREMMGRLLERRGHRVWLAAGVVEAAETAVKIEHLDILISDLGLPDGTGADALQAVSRHHVVRAIALSGFGMEEDIRQSLKAGFAHHLIKPVPVARLLKVIDGQEPAGTA
ncbi:MAG: Two-component system, NtrC family, sensor kinase [Verrucomicrobiaceae bacterium]|nr:Two-component system, NtrC family, sensor kinase [Verrucomicrobiaceae bacterium]